jgi:hypothetical protein
MRRERHRIVVAPGPQQQDLESGVGDQLRAMIDGWIGTRIRVLNIEDAARRRVRDSGGIA